MNILIIDDNQEILFGVEKLLKASHYHTDTASNLALAEEALAQHNYDTSSSPTLG